MGSAATADTGWACSWTSGVIAGVGVDTGAPIGWLVVWGLVQFVPLPDGSGAADVVGRAQGLSETIELAANLTLGEAGVVAGACCEAAGACCGTAFLAHSSIRVRGAGGLACLKSADARGLGSMWVRTSIMSLISSMLCRFRCRRALNSSPFPRYSCSRASPVT